MEFIGFQTQPFGHKSRVVPVGFHWLALGARVPGGPGQEGSLRSALVYLSSGKVLLGPGPMLGLDDGVENTAPGPLTGIPTPGSDSTASLWGAHGKEGESWPWQQGAGKMPKLSSTGQWPLPSAYSVPGTVPGTESMKLTSLMLPPGLTRS